MQLFSFYVLANDDGSIISVMEIPCLLNGIIWLEISCIKFRENDEIFDFKSHSDYLIPDFILSAIFEKSIEIMKFSLDSAGFSYMYSVSVEKSSVKITKMWVV